MQRACACVCLGGHDKSGWETILLCLKIFVCQVFLFLLFKDAASLYRTLSADSIDICGVTEVLCMEEVNKCSK